MTDTFIWYPPKKRTAHMPYGQAGTGGYSLPVAGIMVCSPWKNVKRFLRNIIIKDKKKRRISNIQDNFLQLYPT